MHRGRFLRYLRGVEFRAEDRRRKPQGNPTSLAEFHGLRPFRPGDSPRLVHWRTSARCGELMTREYEDAPGQNLIVVLDTTVERLKDKDETINEEQGREASIPHSSLLFVPFEAAVSLAATVCWEWCRRRGDRLLVAVAGKEPVVLDGLVGLDHGRRVLEALALAQPEVEIDMLALVERLTVNRVPSAALVVVGSGSKPARRCSESRLAAAGGLSRCRRPCGLRFLRTATLRTTCYRSHGVEDSPDNEPAEGTWNCIWTPHV